MTFKQAFEQMEHGEMVKLPSWAGYWYWDDDKQTIMTKCKESQSDNGKDLLDIRETQRVEYTLMNILSDEWVIANEENCPLLGGVAFKNDDEIFSLEDIEATDWMFAE